MKAFSVRNGGFKSANDGMLGSRGAMLFEPYVDRPDYRGHYQEYNSDSNHFGSLKRLVLKGFGILLTKV